MNFDANGVTQGRGRLIRDAGWDTVGDTELQHDDQLTHVSTAACSRDALRRKSELRGSTIRWTS